MKKSLVLSVIVISIFTILLPDTTVFAQSSESGKGLKKRVAVFDFEDKTSHHYRWWTGQHVGEGMADMLVTALVKTGKYRIFERQELEKIMKEQGMGQSGMITQETAVKVGQLLGVELAIMGSVTEFGHAKGGIGGRLKQKGLGLGIKTTSATVGLDVRFVNTSTGEIISAESVRKEAKKSGLAVSTPKFDFNNRNQFDESIVGKATRDAIDAVVELVDQQMPKLPWQAKVIKGNGTIFINSGAEAGVQVGDVFVVYRPGEELIDPDTGISLGTVDTKIGTIRVTNNMVGNGKASQCVAESGSGFARNDLVRLK